MRSSSVPIRAAWPAQNLSDMRIQNCGRQVRRRGGKTDFSTMKFMQDRLHNTPIGPHNPPLFLHKNREFIE